MEILLKDGYITKMIFGKVPVEKDTRRIVFYDYDGVVVYSYSCKEFTDNMTALPALPDRTIDNLTCEGWNLSFSEIEKYISGAEGDVSVGAMYHTTDGKTYIKCKPTETYPTASVCLTPTNANAVTIEWGDGSSDIWETASTAATKTHTYTGVTDTSVYDITISCASGTYAFGTYITGSSNDNNSCVYTDVKMSNKVTSLGDNCFSNCYYLRTVNVPCTITAFGGRCFSNCLNLEFLTIPAGVKSLGDHCFYGAHYFKALTIPYSVTTIGNYCFYFSYSMMSAIIPDSVVSIGNYCFYNSSALKSVTLPRNISTVSAYCFGTCYSLESVDIPNRVTSLGDSAFSNCVLESVVIPENVTTIKSGCFYGCKTLKTVYCKPVVPPTLTGTTSIQSSDRLVIYVPTGSLTAYQGASVWSSYASKMREYDY